MQRAQGDGSRLDAIYRAIFIVGYRVAKVWWFVRRPRQQGAYVAVWCGDDLLLIRNSYKRGDTVPCGGIGRRERPIVAAQRELREEVGVEAARSDLRFAGEIPFVSEYKRDNAHFFELHLEERPQIAIDRREVVAFEFVAKEELRERRLVPALRRYLELRRAIEPLEENEPATR